MYKFKQDLAMAYFRLGSEGVWLYGGRHNVMNGIAGLRGHPLHDRLVERLPL